jgi:hypothetical protein
MVHGAHFGGKGSQFVYERVLSRSVARVTSACALILRVQIFASSTLRYTVDAD